MFWLLMFGILSIVAYVIFWMRGERTASHAMALGWKITWRTFVGLFLILLVLGLLASLG